MTDVTTPTVQNLAGEALSYFTTAHRADGTPFWLLTDNAPEWVRDLCHKAHGNMMPDDWRYNFVVSALNALDDGDAEPGEPSVYTHELTGWLHSRTDRYAYVDDAVEEYGAAVGIIGAITMGYAAEMREVFDILHAELDERAEELVTDEETEQEPEDNYGNDD